VIGQDVSAGAAAAESAMRARAERAIVMAVFAVRATFVVQLVVSLAHSAGRAERPMLFTGLAVAMVLESALLVAVAIRRRELTRRVAFADVAFIVLMLLAEPLYSRPADRVGTWVAWGFGAAAAGALTAGVGPRRLRETVFSALAMVSAYLVVSLPAATRTGLTWTALTNSLALVGFAVGSWLTARLVRDLARAADEARAEAAEAARRAAVERQRVLLHDQATVLSLLSRSGLPPETESALRHQAARGSRQIRAFLAHEDAPAVRLALGGYSLPLAAVLAAVADEFADLPLTLNVDLAGQVNVSPAMAQALAPAVRTLLHNVRRHAAATTVTVHADELSDGSWEVTVQDDGVGFDPAHAFGYGLRVQAGSRLREAGMSVAVESAPGEGTWVTIVGPSA
jgi:signal transduction histidine kinase